MSFWVLVLALAAYFLPLPLLFTLFVFLYMHTCHPQPQTGNETSPKNATQVGYLAKALEGRVRLCGIIEKHHLLCCDVHNLNREKECCEWGTSLRREGGKDGRREGRGMREKERDQVKKTKWKSARETNLWVCEYVWICVYMGGTNLREEMGALRVLSTPFSSSHSWEIWSTELGGTNTQTQIKLPSWEQVFLPLHQSAVFCQPLLKLRLKALLCKRGLLSNTEKNSFHGEKRETNETHLLISILVFH